MAGDDPLATMLEWPGLIVPGRPDDSLLIAKGEHRGTAWTPEQEATLRGWVASLDADAAPGDEPASDEEPPPVPGEEPPDATAYFDSNVRPLVQTRCGGCHGDGGAAPPWMEGDDPMATMVAYPGLVVPGEPESSLLLIKGERQAPPGTAWRARPSRPGSPCSAMGPSRTRVNRRQTMNPPNEPPTATFEAEPDRRPGSGGRGFFDASASTDADGSIVTFRWDFGDGSTGEGSKPTHRYGDPGSYEATLTVTDDRGRSDQAGRRVDIYGGT